MPVFEVLLELLDDQRDVLWLDRYEDDVGVFNDLQAAVWGCCKLRFTRQRIPAFADRKMADLSVRLGSIRAKVCEKLPALFTDVSGPYVLSFNLLL